MTEADTEDEASPAAAPPPAPTRSEAALARYRARVRRARIVYFSIVAVVVAALVTGAAIVYSRGEAAHASLHTFAPPPGGLSLRQPSAAPQPAWRTADRLALGVPLAGGTVITYSEHTVGGRDARTGKRTWSYTRSDRRVCAAAQATNTTIAVYENHGNCDQLAAFASDTGRRRWTRTLDQDGKAINGRPSVQVLPYTVMVASDTAIYAIDPVSGYNRWNYYRYGCRIQRAVLGTAGVLIGQTCAPKVRCGDQKFCTKGPQLLFRDGSAGNGEDSDKNRDKIKWLRRGDRSTPVSADEVISSLRADGRTLDVRQAKDGAPERQVALPAAGDPGPAVGLGATELLWRGGTLVAIRADLDRPVWSIATDGPPTAVDGSGAPAISLAQARITVPLADGIGEIDGDTGRERQRFAIPAGSGAVVHPLGTGFLVGRPDGTAAYR